MSIHGNSFVSTAINNTYLPCLCSNCLLLQIICFSKSSSEIFICMVAIAQPTSIFSANCIAYLQWNCHINYDLFTATSTFWSTCVGYVARNTTKFFVRDCVGQKNLGDMTRASIEKDLERPNNLWNQTIDQYKNRSLLNSITETADLCTTPICYNILFSVADSGPFSPQTKRNREYKYVWVNIRSICT